MGRTLYKVFVMMFFAALFAMGFFWRCASMGYPQGGPKDSLPPRIVSMTPKYGTVNFTEKRIFIEFDEYVTIKEQQKEFYTSPFSGKQPVVMPRGRGIQIEIKDTLDENQTYSFNFCSSIRDNNEGNILQDFRYVFSTGPTIDSMLMSGYTVDAYTRDSIAKTFILFYPAQWDTIPEYDSLPFRAPAAVARAQSNGLFIAENLKPIPYRVYALDDRNTNQKYEPGVDKIAFLDSAYNPADMPDFMIRYDTSRKYNVPDPQLYFRLFMDEGFRRQYLVDASRPVQHKLVFTFGAKYPEIERLQLDGIDSSQIITQYLKPTKDSIALWLHVPSADLPDTIKGEIIYQKHDSLSVLQTTTQKLALGWKAFEDKKKKDKNDTLPPPNPFKYKVDAGATLNPFNNIPISFDYPLVKIDSAAITLTRIEDEEKQFRARLRFVQDTADMLRWTMVSQWVPDANYELKIPAGALVDVAGQKNDSLTAKFTVSPPEKFATLDLVIRGKTPESEYIVQVTDGTGNRVIREILHVRSGKLSVPYLEAGTVRIRVIEDANGNGKWDGGNLIKRMQPERAEVFLTEKGEPDITTKENWTLDFNLDMNVMFAPITMERIMEQLHKQEQTRLMKYLKQQADRQRENQMKPADNSQGGMGFGAVGGAASGAGGFPMPSGMQR